MTISRSDATTGALLEMAIRCLDLTSLEGTETPEQVSALCRKAVHPDPGDDTLPSVAAVVLYPQHVPLAVERLQGSGVNLATVIGFPLPTDPLEKRLDQIREAVALGAEEIDTVLNRDALLSGRGKEAAEEIQLAKAAAGGAVLKVILETGELGSDERIREASTLAMAAGADFIKSSTGKIGTGVTPEAATSMMEAIREFHARTGREVGIKVSGGIRRTEQALAYIHLVDSTLGLDWLSPARFRIGASSLLDDLVGGLRSERGSG